MSASDRNLGVKNGTGDYVQIVGSRNVMARDYLQDVAPISTSTIRKKAVWWLWQWKTNSTKTAAAAAAIAP